jgi:hypothetical protein
MAKTIDAQTLVNILRARDIDPDDTFTAAAGKDYGHVNAWDIDPADGYVIEYGDNGQTNYEFADDADDLRAWLIHELDDESAAIEAANVDGDIEPCSDDCTDVAVMVLRAWYGPRTTADLAREDDGRATVRRFATVADAQTWIEAAEAEQYVLAHNEASAPDYVIVQA